MPKVDPTQAFFDELAERGHEPLLGNITGTLRVEVVDGETSEHWHVDVRKGVLKVSRKNAKADAIVRVPRPLCDKITSGRENAMAAMLRGALVPEGDLRLTMLFQRLFPGPTPKPTSGSGR
jgi:SCP-2 sterol transfer family